MLEQDEFFAQLEAEIAKHINGSGGSDPWALHLIRALWPYPKGAERQDTLKRIENSCSKNGRTLNRTFEQTVQRTFNNYNSDRKGQPPKHALFHCAGQLGSGIWALHYENAKKWMTENRLRLD